MFDKINSETIFKNVPIIVAIENVQPFITHNISDMINEYVDSSLANNQYIYIMKQDGNKKEGRKIGVPKTNFVTYRNTIDFKQFMLSKELLRFRCDSQGNINFFTYKNTANQVLSMIKKAMSNYGPKPTKTTIRFDGKQNGDPDDILVALIMLQWETPFLTDPYYIEIIKKFQILPVY